MWCRDSAARAVPIERPKSLARRCWNDVDRRAKRRVEASEFVARVGRQREDRRPPGADWRATASQNNTRSRQEKNSGNRLKLTSCTLITTGHRERYGAT